MSDDKRLERIEKKLDDTNEHLSSIDVTLAEQHLSLKEHIKRTAILEKEFNPIRRKMDMLSGAIALITLLATVAAIIEFLRH